MNVLIADDDAVSRRLLQSYLQKWGYEVTAAADGAEAWRLFEGGVFPLVITDWMMPELDGPGLVRRIRSLRRPGYVYVILLTAKIQKEDLVEGMEAGADDFLTKPFDRDELRVRLSAGERIIRLEQDLRSAQASLIQSEKLASLGRLAAGMAHEMNNPIAFVLNNLAMLQRDTEAALRVLEKYGEGRAALSRVEPELGAEVARLEEEMDLKYFRENFDRQFRSSTDGLRRIGAIVKNLRDFARLDEAESKEIDLNAAIRSTLEALKYELDQKAIEVRTELPELPLVSCHPGKINQVFLNILENAIEASARGGRIEVRSRPEKEGGVLVEIEDHGEGIKAEHLPRIFEPFFTTKPIGSGTGLGLAVSYGIVRDHGGTLEVESAVRRGSVFRIRLPLRAPAAAADSAPQGS
jgi:signal transduction histidine kinase